MPKRVVDGDSLWTSAKLNTVNPPSFRAEFANIIPMALANGSFECTPALVFRAVYSFNRPDWNVGKVASLLDELERVRLLYRWKDKDGKIWGFFPGIEKRLPPPSEQRKYAKGAEPPREAMSTFLAEVAPESGGHQEEVEKGIGIGVEDGVGEGEGEGDGQPRARTGSHTLSPSTETHSMQSGKWTAVLPSVYNELVDRCARIGIRPEPVSFQDVWGFISRLEERHSGSALLADFDTWCEHNKKAVADQCLRTTPRLIGTWSAQAGFRLCGGVNVTGDETDALARKLSGVSYGAVTFSSGNKRLLGDAVRQFGKDAVTDLFKQSWHELSNSLDLKDFLESIDQCAAADSMETEDESHAAARAAPAVAEAADAAEASSPAPALSST